MTNKTYQVTKTDEEEFVVETQSIEKRRTYHKQWLIDEVARLQAILDEFKK